MTDIPKPNSNLKYTVIISHMDKILAQEEVECNDDVLIYKREREFNMTHRIGDIGTRVVRKAMEKFDSLPVKKNDVA